jgi:DNA mismatch repair protein MutS2
MYLPEKTVALLEFDKIRAMLAELCRTEGARNAALTLCPDDDAVRVDAMQRRTSDAAGLMREKGMPPFGGARDISPHCEKAAKGAMLSPRELLDVGNVLRTCRGLIDYIKVNRTGETVLDEVFERLIPDRRLEDRIYRTIISEDVIADDASPELADCRRKIRQVTAKIRDLLSRYTGGMYSRYLQENIVTIRNGRYVVPVKAEYRGEVKGLVHDTSSSGATLFIEPMAVVDANNELRGLESAERHEIEKILYDLSAEVAAMSAELVYDIENIDELALVFACAEFSAGYDGVRPRISRERRTVDLRRARHPLIPKDRVVPVDVRLGGKFDTLVITGPNTGGKTVTLKTLGLFSLMAQSGLHIPAAEGSSVCVFDKILVDLGDEQSIEQSLSTFSAHMVNIVSIIGELTPDSLALFDELGVGTDPVEGAALAIAIIQEVRGVGALCAATTHYAELKTYALSTPGVTNASCEFDVETLRPTYRLNIGTPGRSCALAISRRLGLPERIVDSALREISTENRRFEDVIDKLEASRVEEEKNREKALRMREDYEKYREQSEAEIARKLKEADRVLESAREKARATVEGARVSSEYVFRQLEKVRKAKDSERFGEELEAARKSIRENIRENEEKYDEPEPDPNAGYVLPRPLHKGDRVWLKNLRQEGMVLSDPDRGGGVSVQVGAVRTKTKISNLKLMDDMVTVTDSSGERKTVGEYTGTVSLRQVSDEIDLRGLTGDEAWSEVDKYIDDVTLAGLHTARLIHGKGTGALRNALWQKLKKDGRIASFRQGQYGEGDSGVTVIELK